MNSETSTPTGLQITSDLYLPQGELRFSFDRSPGPGGQNVNKVNTRAELRFDVGSSRALSDEQRQGLYRALASRLTGDNTLIVRSSRYRSQYRNRLDCQDKLAALLAEALRPPPPKRRRTRPGRAAIARRLQNKRRKATKKGLRRPPTQD